MTSEKSDTVGNPIVRIHTHLRLHDHASMDGGRPIRPDGSRDCGPHPPAIASGSRAYNPRHSDPTDIYNLSNYWYTTFIKISAERGMVGVVQQQDVLGRLLDTSAVFAPVAERSTVSPHDVLRYLEWTISFSAMIDAYLSAGEFTPTELHALRYLAVCGPITLGSLSRAIGVNPSVTTGMADRLEQRRIVERVRLNTDRRNIVMALTEEGHALLQTVIAARAEGLEGLLARGGDTSLGALYTLIQDDLIRMSRHPATERMSPDLSAG